VAFLKNLRTRVGNYLLGKEVTKARQARTILSMKEAKTIGLVFSSNNAEDVDIAKKYENYLKEMGKTVKTIGLINVTAKELPVNTAWWTGPQYITRKELSWFYKPSEEFIRNFVNEPFDMLIDMNIGGELPLRFVSASSKAKCKVGRYDEKYLSIYDVMIETDKTKTLKYFLRNVDTYMDMLDKGNRVNATK
jgi:hypothetical protein